MKSSAILAALLSLVLGCVAPGPLAAEGLVIASPIFGVTIPEGYRSWSLIAVSHEVGLDEIRGILGNDIAMKAFVAGVRPFPDGAVVVKIAWRHVPLRNAPFVGAFVPGSATTVQVMIKNSGRYAATDGWGYGRFIDGKPTDVVQHRTCVACHEGYARQNDFVFTHYAP